MSDFLNEVKKNKEEHNLEFNERQMHRINLAESARSKRRLAWIAIRVIILLVGFAYFYLKIN